MKLLKKILQTHIFKFIAPDFGAPGDHYNLESHLYQVLQTYQIDMVIDVGANEGQFGKRLRKLGFDGTIHSFEPVKKVFAVLSENASSDAQWATHNLALGSEDGHLKINVSESSDFSSILPPNEFGVTRFKGIKTTHQETIPVHRLDKYIRDSLDIGDKRILLKLDTQGYDHHVFEGSKGILENVCCMLSELSLIPIYDGMKPYLETLAIYQQNEFSVSGIYPVSRNKRNLSVIEMDCVLVKQKLCLQN